MSMYNGFEASAVAMEILRLIENLEKKYEDEPKALEALREVKEKARGIKRQGDAGCY